MPVMLRLQGGQIMNAQAHFDSDSRRPLKSASGSSGEGDKTDKGRTRELLTGFRAEALQQTSQGHCSGGVCSIGEWKPKRQS